MILSPKVDFLKSEDAKKLADVVATPWFQHSCTIALAQMQMEMGDADTPAKSWDNWSKVLGARRVINTLLNLPDPNIKERPKLSADLDFRAQSSV